MQHVIWNRLGFQNLLFWLFAYLVVNPFFTSLPHSGYVIDLLFSLVLFFAIFTVSRERKVLSISTSHLILTLLFFWLDIFGVIDFSQVVSYSILVIYLATLVYSFFYSYHNFPEGNTALNLSHSVSLSHYRYVMGCYLYLAGDCGTRVLQRWYSCTGSYPESFVIKFHLF